MLCRLSVRARGRGGGEGGRGSLWEMSQEQVLFVRVRMCNHRRPGMEMYCKALCCQREGKAADSVRTSPQGVRWVTHRRRGRCEFHVTPLVMYVLISTCSHNLETGPPAHQIHHAPIYTDARLIPLDSPTSPPRFYHPHTHCNKDNSAQTCCR